MFKGCLWSRSWFEIILLKLRLDMCMHVLNSHGITNLACNLWNYERLVVYSLMQACLLLNFMGMSTNYIICSECEVKRACMYKSWEYKSWMFEFEHVGDEVVIFWDMHANKLWNWASICCKLCLYRVSTRLWVIWAITCINCWLIFEVKLKNTILGFLEFWGPLERGTVTTLILFTD